MYLKCNCCRQHMDIVIYIVTNYLKAYKTLKTLKQTLKQCF